MVAIAASLPMASQEGATDVGGEQELQRQAERPAQLQPDALCGDAPIPAQEVQPHPGDERTGHPGGDHERPNALGDAGEHERAQPQPLLDRGSPLLKGHGAEWRRQVHAPSSPSLPSI